MAKILLLLVLIALFSSNIALPITDTNDETTQQKQDEQAKQDKQKLGDESKSTQNVTEKPKTQHDKSSEKQDLNEEVTNYQNIEVDNNSRVTGVTQEENTLQQDDFEVTGVLSEDEAQELLLELSDPTSVAEFIVAIDDARGFLQALRLLKDQGYISLDMAYYLRDRVTEELRRMLMLQEMELSRTLLNDYTNDEYPEDQISEEKDASTPYYLDEFNNYIPENEYLTDQEPYSVYQTEDQNENSQALAEIAEIIARRIAAGELTPESGVKIMATVADLLPEDYWRDALEVFAGGNGFYPFGQSSEVLSSEVESLSSQGGPDEQSHLNKIPTNEEVKIDSEEKEDEEEGFDDAEIEKNQLENELQGKELKLEQTLAKQLGEKAKLDNEDAPDGFFEDVDSFDNDNMSEEDYNEFIQWLLTNGLPDDSLQTLRKKQQQKETTNDQDEKPDVPEES